MTGSQNPGIAAAEQVESVGSELVKMFSPAKIYLYNQRVNMGGRTTGFKLCLVMDTEDKSADMRRIYLEIDSDTPFDVLIYTPDEWERLLRDDTSFASKINETGSVLHG